MKKNIGQLTNDVFTLLNGQDNEDITKVLSSVSTLLGISQSQIFDTPNKNGNPILDNSQKSPKNYPKSDVKSFFDDKDPKNKGEEFAVAAKFRIDTNLGEIHTKDDLKTIIKTQAKRVFDEQKFNRDIDNAIRQAKFFISGDTKGHYILSAVGEKFVNALPDRAEALKIKKTKGGKKVKKKVAKKSTKK